MRSEAREEANFRGIFAPPLGPGPKFGPRFCERFLGWIRSAPSRDADWAALHEQETAQATLIVGPCDYAD